MRTHRKKSVPHRNIDQTFKKFGLALSSVGLSKMVERTLMSLYPKDRNYKSPTSKRPGRISVNCTYLFAVDGVFEERYDDLSLFVSIATRTTTHFKAVKKFPTAHTTKGLKMTNALNFR